MKIYKFIQDGDWAVLIRAKNAAKAKYALWKLSLSFGCVWSFMECLSDFYYAGTISKEEAQKLIEAEDCDADFEVHQIEGAEKMSDNEFSENMVVCAVGHLSPGNISDSCESCPHNKFSFPGVLIGGVTKDAVMLLSEKVEIVPEGTKARMAELEASNKELLEALENECRLCRHGNGNSFNPDCPNGKMCLIHGAIQKERGQG